jgi:hypothetical protein
MLSNVAVVEHAPSSGRVTNSRDAFENSAFAQLRTEGFEPDDDGMSVDGRELQSVSISANQ